MVRSGASAGAIRWPEILRTDETADIRSELESRFSQRSRTKGGIGTVNCHEVQQSVRTLRELLRTRIKELDPAEYMLAKKFLDSLAYEARLPANVELVAAK